MLVGARRGWVSSILGAYLALLLPLRTDCWWDIPHMLTAQIADDTIAASTKHRVSLVLKTLSPLYPVEFATLAACSVWPDIIKAKGLHILDEVHYRDLPVVDPSFQAQYDADFCAGADDTEGLPKAFSSLARGVVSPHADRFSRAVALSYLAHLAGDAHQPLHSASRFSAEHPRGDLGGNLYPVSVVGSEDAAILDPAVKNLHSLWDSGAGNWPRSSAAGNEEPLSESGAAWVRAEARRVAEEFPKGGAFAPEEVAEVDPARWVEEGHALATTVAYNTTALPPGAVVPRGYAEAARRVIRRRVALGGYRLATVLDQLYGSDTGPEGAGNAESGGNGAESGGNGAESGGNGAESGGNGAESGGAGKAGAAVLGVLVALLSAAVVAACVVLYRNGLLGRKAVLGGGSAGRGRPVTRPREYTVEMSSISEQRQEMSLAAVAHDEDYVRSRGDSLVDNEHV